MTCSRGDYIHSDSSIVDILVLWVQVVHSSCVLVASSCHGRQQTPQICICHGIHKLAHPSRFERVSLHGIDEIVVILIHFTADGIRLLSSQCTYANLLLRI